MNSIQDKMQVEIWSDVMCPFCYIGKRKFEAAMSEFKDASSIAIIWKSFQLSPGMKTDTGKNIHQYLSEHKGISPEDAKAMNDRMANTARQVGLHLDFDKAIPANSFNAHRFSHLAKHHGLQAEAEERLFKAYFTEGKNTDDLPTLVLLGEEIGLDASEVKRVLDSDQYADEVRHDLLEARQIGIRGVPFFAFDRKVAVSGAQDSKVFLDALTKTFAQWRKENPAKVYQM